MANPEFDRKDLATLVAEATGQSPEQVLATLKATLAAIRDQVAHGHRVEIHELGVFSLATRASRLYRNPATGEGEVKPERRHVAFRAAAKFKRQVTEQQGIECV